jgi:hypothetical protein
MIKKNFDFKKNLQDKNIEDCKKKRKRNIISEEQLKNAIEETKKFRDVSRYSKKYFT